MKKIKLLKNIGLVIYSLIASSCATDPKDAANAIVQTGKVTHQAMQQQSLCAEANSTLASRCSETVTAAFDAQGKLWIAWVAHGRIYVQASIDHGLSFSEPVAVNSQPEDIASQNESRPKLKIDQQGNVFLTWVLTLDKKRSTYVRFSRSVDGGRHFSLPVTVNDNLEIIRHRFDTLALGKNGEILIAWLDARNTETEHRKGKEFKGLSLYYTWSNDGGEHFYPNRKIVDHTCECCRLDSAVNKQNFPVILWRHIFDGKIRDHALSTFSSWEKPGTLVPVGKEDWLIDACPHHGPGLSISDSGSYHTVWFSNSETKQGLFYAHSVDAGQHFSEPMHFGNKGASHPHVLALGQQVGVVWQEFDGKLSRALFMHSDDAGKSWSQPLTLAKTPEMPDEPFLITDGRRFYLSWHVPKQDYRSIPLDEQINKTGRI